MTLTIEIAPDVQRRLEAKARRRGVPVERYLREVVEREAAKPESIGATPSYTQSLQSDSELTAFSTDQEDIHEYSATELLAMAGGAFERPQP